MTTMSDLKEAKRFLESVRGEGPLSVLAAVSGGLDSMCLLHLLAAWGREQNLTVTAAHFNHQLRGEAADRDEAFVRDICAQWDIPCVCGGGDTRALAEQNGLSIEEAARQLRYQFLEEQQQALGCTYVLTAHHADDHAETMLLNLLRGTGPKGLAGIPEFRGRIARPLLRLTRGELETYAKKHAIPHVEDETNAELDAARNVLRHKVFPVLRELNPRAVENMTRTAELLSQDEEALSCQTEQFLRQYVRWENGRRAVLPADVCLQQPQAVVSRVLLAMMTRIGGHRQDLTHTHVDAALQLLRLGQPGQEISLPYGMTAVREQGGLSIRRERLPLPDALPIVPGQSVVFGDWHISLNENIPPKGEYYMISLQKCDSVQVTRWQSCDRMTLSGSRGSRSVKRLAAERGISPAERDRLPVLRFNSSVVAIPGIGVDMKFLPDTKERIVLVTFLKQAEERNHEK